MLDADGRIDASGRSTRSRSCRRRRRSRSTRRRGTRSSSGSSGATDLPNAVALSSSLGTIGAHRRAGARRPRRRVRRARASPSRSTRASYVVDHRVPLARDAASRRARRRDRDATGARRASRTRCASPSTRGASPSRSSPCSRCRTFSFNFDVLLPLVADADAERGRGGVRADRRRVRRGALCGALILATVGTRAPAPRCSAARSASALFELLLAPQDSLPSCACCCSRPAIFYMLWGTNALSTLQLAAPEHLRGRAASLYFFAFLGGAPLGGLLAGWLVARRRHAGSPSPPPVPSSRSWHRGMASVLAVRRPRRTPSQAVQRAGHDLGDRRDGRALDLAVADRRVGDEPDRPRRRSSASTPRSLSWPSDLRHREAGGGHVDEDDVRLGRPGQPGPDRGQQRGELPGAAVVVGEPVDHRVERDEACGGCDARLVHRPAAEPLQVQARVRDRRPRCRRARAPNGRTEALVEAERDRVDRGRERGERDAERDGRVRQPRAVEVHAHAVPLRRVGERGRRARARAPCRRRACACSRGTARRRARRDRGLDRGRIEPAVGRPERARARGRRPPSATSPSEVRMCGRRLEHDRPSAALARARAARRGSPCRTSAPRRPPPCRAALPRDARARSRSRPRRRSPSRAARARIASHISSVGGAQRSERRSIIAIATSGPQEVPPGPRAGVLARVDDGDAVDEHVLDALARSGAGRRRVETSSSPSKSKTTTSAA